MSELEQLIQQKNEIQKKIQEIKRKGVVSVGNIKLDHPSYGGWYIAIKTSRYPNNPRKKYQSITAQHSNREDAIKEIPEIIKNLQALYDKEMSGGQESDS